MAQYQRVFACWGQSNSEGRDQASGYSTAAPLSYNYKSGAWNPLVDPSGLSASAGASYRPKLSQQHASNYGSRSIGFIPCGVGGKSISSVWSDDTTGVYTNAVAYVTAAGGCHGIVYFGGETDVIDAETEATVRDSTLLMMSNARRDLGVGNLPFWFVQPYHYSYNAARNNAVRDGITAACAANANAWVVADAAGKDRIVADNVHLSRSGQDALAVDLFAGLKAAGAFNYHHIANVSSISVSLSVAL